VAELISAIAFGESTIDCSEQALVRSASAADPAAIGELYRRFGQPVYRYFYMRVRDRHTAEDLAGDVFLKVIEALPRYVDRGRPFAAWVFRIARFRIIDYYRQTKAVPQAIIDDTWPDDAFEGSESTAIRRLEHRILHAQIGDLTDDHLMVVQLRFF
jgi:RNA polymerase sigma-70 factor (ECF subfamily)